MIPQIQSAYLMQTISCLWRPILENSASGGQKRFYMGMGGGDTQGSGVGLKLITQNSLAASGQQNSSIERTKWAKAE